MCAKWKYEYVLQVPRSLCVVVGGLGPQTVQTYMQIIHSISIMKGIAPLIIIIIIIIATQNEWESVVKWMGSDEKMH